MSATAILSCGHERTVAESNKVGYPAACVECGYVWRTIASMSPNPTTSKERETW